MTTASYFGDPRRRESEELAFFAEKCARQGKYQDAAELYRRAADLETQVVEDLRDAPVRVRSVLAVSAVALWFKCGDIVNTQKYAYKFLSSYDSLIDEDRLELERILQRCWQKRTISDLMNSGNYTDIAPLELKLAGGQIQKGLAPTGIVRAIQETAYSGIMRTTEIQMRVPFRSAGKAGKDISGQISVYEVPAISASYGIQLLVASTPIVGKGQATSNALEEPKISCVAGKVVSKFLEFADIASKYPEDMKGHIPNRQYRHEMLAIFCDMSPDGRQCEQVRLSTTINGGNLHMSLNTGQRDLIAQAIRKEQDLDQLNNVIGLLEELDSGFKNPHFEIKIAETHAHFTEGERIRFHVKPSNADELRKKMLTYAGQLVTVNYVPVGRGNYGLQYIAQGLTPIRTGGGQVVQVTADPSDGQKG